MMKKLGYVIFKIYPKKRKAQSGKQQEISIETNKKKNKL